MPSLFFKILNLFYEKMVFSLGHSQVAIFIQYFNWLVLSWLRTESGYGLQTGLWPTVRGARRNFLSGGLKF